MRIDGVYMIGRERAKHHGKGWTESHDLEHTDGMLAKVAASLAVQHTDARLVDPNTAGEEFGDPWRLIEKHPDEIERLVVAGALIAAEIDRLRNERSIKVSGASDDGYRSCPYCGRRYALHPEGIEIGMAEHVSRAHDVGGESQ